MFIAWYGGITSRKNEVGYSTSPCVTTSMYGKPPMIIGFQSGKCPVR